MTLGHRSYKLIVDEKTITTIERDIMKIEPRQTASLIISQQMKKHATYWPKAKLMAYDGHDADLLIDQSDSIEAHDDAMHDQTHDTVTSHISTYGDSLVSWRDLLHVDISALPEDSPIISVIRKVCPSDTLPCAIDIIPLESGALSVCFYDREDSIGHYRWSNTKDTIASYVKDVLSMTKNDMCYAVMHRTGSIMTEESVSQVPKHELNELSEELHHLAIKLTDLIADVEYDDVLLKGLVNHQEQVNDAQRLIRQYRLGYDDYHTPVRNEDTYSKMQSMYRELLDESRDMKDMIQQMDSLTDTHKQTYTTVLQCAKIMDHHEQTGRSIESPSY
jgi:hypothetical protein